MTTYIRLDELMRAHHLTAKELSHQTGITEAAISEWRTNKVKRIARSTLNRLCAALQCTPGDLIVYIPDPALPPHL